MKLLNGGSVQLRDVLVNIVRIERAESTDLDLEVASRMYHEGMVSTSDRQLCSGNCIDCSSINLENF